MPIKKTAVATFVLFCAGAHGAAAGEVAPKTPLECRQRVVEEIQRFRDMKSPKIGGGDEHIARSTIWNFHELKGETTLILASTGDKEAMKTVIRELELERADDRVYPFWSYRIFAVVQVMETQQPELAKKTRERMMRQRGSEGKPRVREGAKFERMTLKELKKAALEGEPEAMRRWACLDRDDAAPFLAQRMNDANRSPYENCLAAEALATIGDERGLSWLRDKARSPGGGNWAGLSLLHAGEAGQKIFFDLVKEHEKNNDELPHNLTQAPLELNTEVYFKLLARLSEIKDNKFRYNLDHAIHNHRLPAATLSFLIDRARKDDRKESFLIDAIWRSIILNGVEDAKAREVAQLWADELLSANDTYKWECGAQLFLKAGLGSKDVAAATARRQLAKSTKLAADVLAETGRAEDALLIWAATHRASKEERRNWYDGPALGWSATVRLTNHLPTPK